MVRCFALLLMFQVFGVLLFSSCTRPSYQEPQDLFVTQKDVSSKPFEVSGLQLNNPYNLILMDSLLIIHDKYAIRDTTYFFSISDVNNQKLKKYFGREGRGPDEFLFPSMLSKIPNAPNKFGINNRRLFSFSEVLLPNILSDAQNFTISKTDELSASYSKVVKLSDDVLVGTGFFEEGRFGLSDENGNLLSVQHSYPFQEKIEGMDVRTMGMAMQSNLIIHPSDNRMVAATTSSANIDILFFEDDSLKVKKSIHLNPPLVENNSSSNTLSAHFLPENRRGYESLAATENYFYALYSGTKRKEGLDKYLTGKIVFQFDWEGTPVQQYNLDHPSKLIVVDEDDQNLYAVTADSSGMYSLFKYNLN